MHHRKKKRNYLKQKGCKYSELLLMKCKNVKRALGSNFHFLQFVQNKASHFFACSSISNILSELLHAIN